MNFEQIVESTELARRDGLEPTQLHLGTHELEMLLTDANFSRATAKSHTNTGGSIGTVFGIEVQSVPQSHMRIMTAQEDDYFAYYIV